MPDKTIVQLAVFEAPSQRVYDALTNSKQHSEFTGEKAVIDAKAGGVFKEYGDYISGTFLKILPGKKIVQKWRASDWLEGVYSTVTIQLQEKNGVTTLHLKQDG